MAIVIRGKSQCSLCGGVLDNEADLIATSHFIHDATNPFWRYSDSATHKECFIAWPQGEAFRAIFNDLCGNGGHPLQMLEDGTVVKVAQQTNR